MKIRVSPSGPVVENSSGGPFEPGTGAMLRLSEGTTAIGGSLRILTTAQTIGTILNGGTVLVGSLDEPDPNLNYRATVLLDVLNTSTNTASTVILYLDTSVDGGSTWVNEVANAHVLGAGTGTTEDVANGRQIRCDMTLRLGSQLDSLMAVGSPSLKVRARIRQVADVTTAVVNSLGTADSESMIGTAYLSLSEHF